MLKFYFASVRIILIIFIWIPTTSNNGLFGVTVPTWFSGTGTVPSSAVPVLVYNNFQFEFYLFCSPVDNVNVLLELPLHLVALLALRALKPIRLHANVTLPPRPILEHLAADLTIHVQVHALFVQHFVSRQTRHVVAEIALVTTAAIRRP